MASILPSHRKQHVPITKDDRISLQHPLSPHTAEDDQLMDDIDSDDNVLLYSHPLSPHATSRQDDQAQCINENNTHTVPTANVIVTAHPLSPHTTTVEDETQSLRSQSLSSTTTPSHTTNSMLTPMSSFTAQDLTTTTAAANSRFVAANSTHTAVMPSLSTNKNNNAYSRTILVINGPNLNLLGHREPHIYGSTTLHDITRNLSKIANEQGINLQHFQSNHEADIINRIHACLLGTLPTPITSTEYSHQQQPNHSKNEIPFPKPDAILINPGAFTHTSVALRDALLGISTPFIEIHISNVHAREQFRHKSFLSDKAEAVICGLGIYGYEAGLAYWVRKWNLTGGKNH